MTKKQPASLSSLKAYPALAFDIDWVSSHLREADKLELESMGGMSAQECIEIGVRQSFPFTRTIRHKCVPIALFGVIPTMIDGVKTGLVWLVGTEGISTHRFPFLRATRRWMRKLPRISLVDRLYTTCDSRNGEHMRWLQWSGWEMDANPIFVGPSNVRLYRFFFEVK